MTWVLSKENEIGEGILSQFLMI